MAKPVLVTRKRNVTGSVSFGRQIGFRFTVFNTRAYPFTFGFTSSALAGAYNYPPEPDTLDIEPPQSDGQYTDTPADSGEGEISSDNLEKPEQTEDMNYWETVKSVCSFMGWNHIPTFKSDLGESDKSNNPWKGKTSKHPARISVAMPPDQDMKLSQNSFRTTGLTTCGSYWSVRKFISPICKHENEKLLDGYKNIY